MYKKVWSLLRIIYQYVPKLKMYQPLNKTATLNLLKNILLNICWIYVQEYSLSILLIINTKIISNLIQQNHLSSVYWLIMAHYSATFRINEVDL